MIVTPIETRICFLFKIGFCSSCFPITNPMVTEASHTVKKTSANKMASTFSIKGEKQRVVVGLKRIRHIIFVELGLPRKLSGN